MKSVGVPLSGCCLIFEGCEFRFHGVLWRRACECVGPSRTGRVKLREDVWGEFTEITISATPGPVCTICDKAWDKVDES